MKVSSLFLLLLVAVLGTARAQYPPQAGIAGSTAIPASDTRFREWASACTIRRGYKDIARPDSGRVTQGDSTLAQGLPDGQVVSLGDSGVAVVQFVHPIRNGDGADFAVFENGFPNPLNAEEAFLELAFVEVSSDGVAFTRFPAHSTVPAAPQLSSVAGAGYINARQLHNLAGKYQSGWGTPFDLQELAGTPGLDVNRITHVRVVDVVGAVNGWGTLDADGRIINDPYPTAFATGGFDLDGVGVLNSTAPAGVGPSELDATFRVHPNPASGWLQVSGPASPWQYTLTATSGAPVRSGSGAGMAVLDVASLPAGVYFLTVVDLNGRVWRERIGKY